MPFTFSPERDPMDVPERRAAELSLAQERGLEEYKDRLRMTDADLAGKEILDLGSGPTNKFVQDAEKQLPGTRVVSFDYSFDVPRRTDLGAELTEEAKKHATEHDRVRGLFTKLPFVDNSFDVIVSSAAMPMYLNRPDQIEHSFDESSKLFEQILNKKKFKDQIEFEILPEETVQHLDRYFGDFDTKVLKNSVLIIKKK